MRLRKGDLTVGQPTTPNRSAVTLRSELVMITDQARRAAERLRTNSPKQAQLERTLKEIRLGCDRIEEAMKG